MSLAPRDGTRSDRTIRARATDREVRLLAEIQRRAKRPDQSDALRFCLHEGARAVGIEQPSAWGIEPEESKP